VLNAYNAKVFLIEGIIVNNNMTHDQMYAISRDRMEEIMKEVRNRCKNDKVFEQELIQDPTETLKKEGLKLQPGISFQVTKTEEEARQLPDNVIPLSFEQNSLDIEDLDKVAGGGNVFEDQAAKEYMEKEMERRRNAGG
jgi:hypothetical protein